MLNTYLALNSIQQCCGSGFIESGSGYGSGSRVLMAKIVKNTAENSFMLFWSKNAISLSQATGESFSPQKKSFSTSKDENY
jgi:hypothetical protein